MFRYIFLALIPGILVGLNLRLLTLPFPEGRHGLVRGVSIESELYGHSDRGYVESIQVLERRLQSEWERAQRQEDGAARQLQNFYVPQPATNRSSVELSLVMATHCSVDRMQDRIPLLMEYWRGPASLAIYISTVEQIPQLSQILQNLSLMDQGRILGGDTILHFLLEPSGPPSYPHNILRNLAMSHNFGLTTSEDDFVLALDADFLPTWNAHTKFMNILYNPQQKQGDSFLKMLRRKIALVLPVFNMVPKSNSDGGDVEFQTMVDTLPKTRPEAIELYHQDILQLWPYKVGHQSSNYTQWLKYPTDDKDSMIPSFPIIPSKGYEPYFIAHRPSLPPYYEAFRGFGLNKQSFVAQIVLEDFEFQVLCDFYLIHLAHPSNHNDQEREANIIEWQSHFKPYLRQKYPKASAYQKRFFNIPFLQE